MSPVLAAFWILDPIYGVMGRVLAFFYSVVPSYGFSIALLTVAVRVLLIPLTTKQVKSQQAMQRIQPEIKRLQAKYKNDRQKLNEEMMKFYKENKVNPLAGCLPILLQAPLFIVLYRVILGLSHQPRPKHLPANSKLYMSLVESGGRMVSWGIDLAKSASSVGSFGKAFPYYILVALTVATGYFQQRQMTARLPKDAVNPQMQMVTKVFPAIIGFISLSVPAGVVVYFIISNLWQIGQQAVTFRAFPPPHLAGGAGGGSAKDDKEGPRSPAKGKGGGNGASGQGRSGRNAPPARGSKGTGAGGRNSGSTGRTTPAGGAKGQPKGGKRPPPSPRPKGLPAPEGKRRPGPSGPDAGPKSGAGDASPKGGAGDASTNGSAGKNTRRKGR